MLIRTLMLSCLIAVVAITMPAGAQFRRGDINGDGAYNLIDEINLLNYLIGQGDALDCNGLPNSDVADVNDNEYATIADALALGKAIYGGGSIPAPAGSCGHDPTGPGLFPGTNPQYTITAFTTAVGNSVEVALYVQAPTQFHAVQLVIDAGALTIADPPFQSIPGFSWWLNEPLVNGNQLLVQLSTTPVSNPVGPGMYIGTAYFQRTGTVVPCAELTFPNSGTFSGVHYYSTVVNSQFHDHSPLVLCQADIPFLRGDANSDGVVNIGDPVATLSYLFSTGNAACHKALDANGDNSVNIADAVYSLTFLFDNGPQPLPPFPSCGVDAISFNLSCAQSPFCAP